MEKTIIKLKYLWSFYCKGDALPTELSALLVAILKAKFTFTLKLNAFPVSACSILKQKK